MSTTTTVMQTKRLSPLPGVHVMFEMSVWGFVVRFLHSLAQSAPFLLTGFLVAAVFRKFYGPAGTFRLFGSNSRLGLARAWAIGMLLPVCSLGAIPVARELRRSGLNGGTILAFAISAPLFNPLSLLYGLTLSEPIAILAFAAGSLVIVTLLGVFWDRLIPGSALPVPEEEPVSPGIRRVVAVTVAAGKDITGPSLAFVVAGLIGVGLLGAVLPANSLQLAFNHDNALAPVTMAGLAVPVYATPMLAMSQMGMMFQHANSIGAAFVLLTLGAGINVGLIIWMLVSFGWKRAMVWLAILMAISLGVGYAIDQPLFPTDIQPAAHTHAFDIYCCPFFPGAQPGGSYRAVTIEKLGRDIRVYEWYSMTILIGCIVLGAIIRLVDFNGRIQRWCEQTVGSRRGDIVIPARLLGGLVLASLVFMSIAGCYAYYPPPSVTLAEMSTAKTQSLSAALTGDVRHATYWIEIYDDWSRKLEVGTFLRHGSLSDYHRWKARLLREQLELMKHTLEEGETVRMNQWVAKLQRTHTRLKDAYTNL